LATSQWKKQKKTKTPKEKELVIPAAFATVFTIPARSGKAHEPARRLASGLTGKLFLASEKKKS
jgi:hypothetical protein